jgi:Uma2 family endonuclease
VSYYSFTRLPPEPLPEGYLDVVPELVFEVRSPGDRWAKITSKVGEYFDAGVLVAGVLDPSKGRLAAYRSDELSQVLEADDTFSLQELPGDFECRVGLFLD